MAKQKRVISADNLSPWHWPVAWQYALAAGAVAVALLARWLLSDLVENRAHFIVLLAVLLPLVQLVRLGPFLAAAFVGWSASVYLYVPTYMSFSFESGYHLALSLMFAAILLAGAFTAWLSHRSRDQRERDQRALAKAEEAASHLAAIVDSSMDAIISKQLDGTITSWNKSAERLLGYTAEEAIGKSITMLIPPDRIQEEYEILARLSRGERIKHFDTVRLRKDGTLIDLSLTVSPVRDAAGRVIGASKMARDITERKLTEQALLDADRRKNEFLATLAHELRSPLAAINLAMQVLDKTSYDPKRVVEMTELIQRQSFQLKRLIDDLMDVERISRGKVKLERKRFDIVAVVKQVISDSQAAFEGEGLTLRSTLPAQAIIVDADSVRFAQVVNNLLHNASKFTECGGEVHVSVEREGKQALVRVADTGVGLAPDQLTRIFDMFAQVEESPGMRAAGLGIGLSLAKSIVDMQGGSITAQSEGRGKGSVFSVRLQALDENTVAPAEPQLQTETIATDSRQRIVAADDNADALNAVALMLRMKGHRVQTAINGVEAIAQIRSQRPDVALLDIGMPGMDGYEVARLVRQEPWGNGLLLVAMTGWGQAKDKRQALEAGFDAHMTKPVDLHELEQLFSSKQLKRQAQSGKPDQTRKAV